MTELPSSLLLINLASITRIKSFFKHTSINYNKTMLRILIKYSLAKLNIKNKDKDDINNKVILYYHHCNIAFSITI